MLGMNPMAFYIMCSFKDRVSLCRPGYLETCCIDQADLELASVLLCVRRPSIIHQSWLLFY